MISFWFNYPFWSETDTSYCILVKCTGKTSSDKAWFPKSECQMTLISGTKAVISVPEWLFNKMNLKERINDYQIISNEKE